LENTAIVGGGDAIGKTIERNNIRALGEDGDAVDYQLKGAAPFVRLAIEDDGTQAGLGLASFRGGLSPRRYLRGELVERLVAVSCGPPELGLANLNGKINDVAAGMETDVFDDR